MNLARAEGRAGEENLSGTVFGREYQQFLRAGYTLQGNDLVTPGGSPP